MINDHRSTTKLNNGSHPEPEEWKIQLVMQNNCISTKNFDDTHTVYSASKPADAFMGSNTDETIDTLFDTLLQRFQQAIETSNDNGSRFTHESVAFLYYYFMKIDIKRAKSYIESSD